MSAAKIAEAMADKWKMRVTKNMIIGAMNRYGRNVDRMVPRRVITNKPRPRRVAAPKPQIMETNLRRVRPVAGKTCQYLHGEPSLRNFCGAPAVMDVDVPQAGHSWCVEHLNVVLIPRSIKMDKIAQRVNGRIVWTSRPKS